MITNETHDDLVAASPDGLGTAGLALWADIAAQVAEDGLALDARERRYLRDACAEADQLARVETALDAEPTMVDGYKGQPRPNGLLAEATRCRTAIANLLGRLALDDDEPGRNGRGSRTTSESARRAALIRHHGEGR